MGADQWQALEQHGRALQVETAALLARCRRAGARSEAVRRTAHALISARDGSPSPRPAWPPREPWNREPADQGPATPGVALDAVPVTELFTLWVDVHGLGVEDALRALLTHLPRAGYSPDADTVSAADALKMTHQVGEQR